VEQIALHLQTSTRPALDSDKLPIWRLYEAAFRPHIELIWGWDDAWQAADFDKAFGSSLTRVVEVGGEFAGYLRVDGGEVDDYLGMLVLLPQFRSLGLGACLLATVQARARREGRGLYLRVFRTNSAAKRFYEREGWVVVADEGNFPGDAARNAPLRRLMFASSGACSIRPRLTARPPRPFAAPV
jgi:ribosomal protein S18 acetylase RimI-like enzyme